MKLTNISLRLRNIARSMPNTVTTLKAAALALLLASAAQAQVVSVGHYTWAGNGSVNTHWIETPNGVIVVDVQRDLQHAREAIAAVGKLGKPVKAIFVTHGHPDHYAGLGVFRERWPGLDIYASKETADVIKNDLYGFHAVAQQMAPGSFPSTFPDVNKIIPGSKTIVIDGARIEMREMGRSEANSASVLYLPQTRDLFTGDLVTTRMHGFFYEESTAPWLGALNRLESNFPKAIRVRPGHGEPLSAKLAIKEQRDYITISRKIVRENLVRSVLLTPAVKGEIIAQLKQKFPNLGLSTGRFELDDHLSLNVESLIKEFARDGARAARR
jgi:glyoxylase-like metal-dependent hydrolase (beta-lactamase superfamily II)